MTDDPDTPGPGYWEINLSMLLEKSRAERRIGAPFADINYGVGNRIQLKFEIPWLSVSKTGERFQSGPGNATLGVKWRFLGEEGRKLAWSIYPQLEVNTGSALAANGLVDQGRQLLLPTEVTFETGPIEINGEVGRTFASEGGNGWIYGLSTEYTLRRGLELLAEMHGERSGDEPAELLINIGGRQKLTEQIILLIAVGSAVRGLPDERTRLRLYAGVQFNLPGQYVFDQLHISDEKRRRQ